MAFGKTLSVPSSRIAAALKSPVTSAKEVDSAWARMTRASSDSEFEAARAEFSKLVG